MSNDNVVSINPGTPALDDEIVKFSRREASPMQAGMAVHHLKCLFETIVFLNEYDDGDESQRLSKELAYIGQDIARDLSGRI